MKRARIKAMVTVPARRKAVQDSPSSETTSTLENDVKSPLPLEAPATPQSYSENNYQEKHSQESEEATNHIKSEELSINDVSTEFKDRTEEYSESSEQAIVQTTESQSTIQITSPTKVTQNRSCFMRPTPRLDTGGRVRRNSIQGSGASASESEDDSRRVPSTTSNCVRNDSVCPVQSTKETTANISQNNVTKFKATPKRRMLVSESARKLAEARREFLIKHENKTPDRSKLTMYDLIYYNPIGNPMKVKRSKLSLTRQVSICQSEEPQEEENEDDPSAMPVPQVKVGPDGQLIIDEQSLVIEQTNAKKSREVLAKEAIVDDDTGSGFYKRRPKSKEWPKWETLKFYKALNTVGTDFLLMQSLFPNRTRQEIKLKFKKEEKVNRNLVEKALAYHQEFNTELLEQSLATFEDSEREQTNVQVKQKHQETKDKRKVKERKRKHRVVASSIAEMASEDEDDPGIHTPVMQEGDGEANNNQSVKKEIRQDCKKQKIEKHANENPLAEVNDTESLSSNNHSDSDTEIYHVRPTRSGRSPRVKRLQAPDTNTLDNETSDNSTIDHDATMLPVDNTVEADAADISDNTNTNSETQCTDTIKNVIPDISQVEPGSLVILSKESSEEPGKSVLQVYMVSSNINSSQDEKEPNITPVDLSPELLATVTTRLSDVEPISIKKECE